MPLNHAIIIASYVFRTVNFRPGNCDLPISGRSSAPGRSANAWSTATPLAFTPSPRRASATVACTSLEMPNVGCSSALARCCSAASAAANRISKPDITSASANIHPTNQISVSNRGGHRVHKIVDSDVYFVTDTYARRTSPKAVP